MNRHNRFFSKATMLLSLFLFVGCASHVKKMSPVKDKLRGRQFDQALIMLDEKLGTDEDNLVWLLERGLLLRHAGRYLESEVEFERAERLAADLYTKSISRTVAALISSDTTLPYEGEEFERVAINYYRALNYLDMNMPEDALVECRKVIAKLRYYEEQYDGTDAKKYTRDPFILYLTGLIYESAGDLNDAYISYKNALVAQDAAPDLFPQRNPLLGDDLITAASRLGFIDDVAEIRKRFTESKIHTRLPARHGKLIVLVEAGFMTPKVSTELSVPILEDEADETDIGRLSLTLRDRTHVRGSDWDVHYWLRYALPSYPPHENPPWSSVTINGQEAFLVQDFDRLARASLEDRMPGILLRSIVRGIIKYLATTKGEDAVKEKHGDVAGEIFGGLLNIAAAATENADLRSWLGLPREIYMTRLTLPEGPSAIEINLLDSRGRTINSVTLKKSVKAGATHFLNYRFFR